MLCLTDTAIRRGPLIGILGEGQGSQPGACGALAARRLRFVKATVVAALQRALVRILGLAHHRERHSAEWLQENRVLRVTGLRSPKMQGRFILFKEEGRILAYLAGYYFFICLHHKTQVSTSSHEGSVKARVFFFYFLK